MDRQRMLEEIYDAVGHTYPDIRKYNTEGKILRRRLAIQKILRGLPTSGKRIRTRGEKLLRKESLLLKYKYLLYTNSEELPLANLNTTRFLVEAADCLFRHEETTEQSERLKRCQTVLLIHLSHLKSTEAEFMSFYRQKMQMIQ